MIAMVVSSLLSLHHLIICTFANNQPPVRSEWAIRAVVLWWTNWNLRHGNTDYFFQLFFESVQHNVVSCSLCEGCHATEMKVRAATPPLWLSLVVQR